MFTVNSGLFIITEFIKLMHKNKRDILKLLIDISIIQQNYCKTEVYCKVSSMYIYIYIYIY